MVFLQVEDTKKMINDNNTPKDEHTKRSSDTQRHIRVSFGWRDWTSIIIPEIGETRFPLC
jgi:hypothetical protein